MRGDSSIGMSNLPSQPPSENFVTMLVQHQLQLRGYIMASLSNHADTDDVLQRANLTLWRKAGEFREGAEFLPWAITVTRFEVLSFLRDHGRDKLVFDLDVHELICDSAATNLTAMPQRQLALRACISKLTDENRDLLNRKYFQQHSISQIAKMTERTIDSVKSLMQRIRRRLAECVERHLMKDGD